MDWAVAVHMRGLPRGHWQPTEWESRPGNEEIEAQKSRQIGRSRTNKTVPHEGNYLKLDALMDRQSFKRVPNKSKHMGKPRDATK